MMGKNFSLTNTTKSTLPGVPFAKIKNKALGSKYSLSLVFIGEKKSQTLNKIYRGKNKPTNVLSFNISKNKGEIFITPSVVRRQIKLFQRKFDNLVTFLFIHGLMHLKGMEHGSRMGRAETKLREQFKL
ncbi:MAG: rRNA maturation RNase YbeY [Candidatus Zambryskibacteria bacterium RIFCSPLOWO2_12_FULL_39_23]|uniref:Endoribonuclease YbeY n=1 Tax=Candidatus Zambryskibacteria bacterium RIFCSPLOWO2_12_FULL_39_23 TaxID=1802776 RepID=A0A1G2UUL0_9BACT|nr:MAG: rRNA maturation RNase YbeY [Candidatus Zambryskibacteria bacterium RIFCSPHIGHO2_12_FULL_39_47]OHB12952.1 MAG: rRNA maturation RNase YbeY [Candidatus Zambryskibacteria bacterium RIFCSPLOWO2_12_FULL_39_23]